jgi:hypothetical protein
MPGQTNFNIVNLPPDAGFFITATTNGTDANGLSDAYRHLVGGTNTLANDFNANSIPDAWEISFFGGLLPSGTDYDNDSVTIAEEFPRGIDPNKIQFTLSASNQYLKSTPVGLQLSILGGVPASMALLVDSTNFDAAEWSPYNPNLTVSPATHEGWHTAWVGLRGRLAASLQTWQRARFKLDYTPPVLTFTNAAGFSGSRPLIQIKGYTEETLASLVFDLTNAESVVKHGTGLVVSQFFDTNTFDLTTNWFECLDLRLAQGSNFIRLSATDLAGNLWVTNIVSIFNTNGDSTAPAISLIWPQDQTTCSHSNGCRDRRHNKTNRRKYA